MANPRDESLTRVELARLEGTVKALVDELRGLRVDLGARVDDHESRLRPMDGIPARVTAMEAWRQAVDRWRYSLPATVVVAVAGLLVGILKH